MYLPFRIVVPIMKSAIYRSIKAEITGLKTPEVSGSNVKDKTEIVVKWRTVLSNAYTTVPHLNWLSSFTNILFLFVSEAF